MEPKENLLLCNQIVFGTSTSASRFTYMHPPNNQHTKQQYELPDTCCIGTHNRGEFSCPTDDLKVPSRFMSNGQTLVYEVRCVERALHKEINLPTRPAIIVMSISEDHQEAWFQVTTLTHNSGEAVTWVSNWGGQDFVIHRSIA